IPATNCSMTATAEGRSLIATVWGPLTEIRNSAPMCLPLVTFGVAEHSRGGAKLWRMLHQAREPEVQTSPDNCPPEPWVAARMEVGIALLPEHAEWIGDFERCVGWAWLERAGGGKRHGKKQGAPLLCPKAGAASRGVSNCRRKQSGCPAARGGGSRRRC